MTRSAPLFWKRVDYPDVLYLNARPSAGRSPGKFFACHARGRPLLVGTTSVADSEELARYLEAPLLLRLAQARLLQAGLAAGASCSLHPDLPVEDAEIPEALPWGWSARNAWRAPLPA